MDSGNKDKKYTFHFIPNTHWDREWLYDFQETRMFLVEFMDKLLDIFNEYPEYKSYLLDSQVIPIEDYLEIRPERKGEVKERIRECKLQVGPWYTLPEEHLVNGESLVRNLLVGHRISAKYGNTMKIGYSPFSYGQASQMPQIYSGFDIDTILFYHGVQASEVPSEFIFEGADGTRLLGSRMGSNARYNFFFSVYRPAVYGKEILERDYSWKEKGLPFHIISNGKHIHHHILVDPIKNLDLDAVKKYMALMKEEELEHSTTDHIACMQGMDSTQPDVYEMKTMEAAKDCLENDAIYHSSLPEYIEELKSSVNWEELKILKGERRTPRLLGTRVHLYGDVTSARTTMKRKNSLAEHELQRKAEPYASFSSLFGKEYPKSFLDLAWKYLLQSHPHDSIAGTGVDQIENDMHHRLEQSRNITSSVISRSLQAIQGNINTSDLGENEIALTIYNPSPYKRSEVVSVVIDIPKELGYEQYCIVDATNGEMIQFQEEERYDHPAVVRHLGDATMQMPSHRVHIHILANDISALGFKTFVIKPYSNDVKPDKSLISSENYMENNFIACKINENGTITLTDKIQNQTYDQLHFFANNGEVGHAWRHVPPQNDIIIDTLNTRADIELVTGGPLLTRFLVTYRMNLPVKMDEGTGNYITRLDADGDDAGRSDETREMVIKSEFTLTKLSQKIDIKTTFINPCEDHRLRVMFPSNINSHYSYAEEPFDVVERPIDRGPDSPWKDTWNPTHPHQRFVDVSDNKIGLAIINDGLREYEVVDNETRTIGLTLLRAFEVALTTVAWKWERHRQMKGSQSLGFHEFKYSIYPHGGDWTEGRVLKQADIFNNHLDVVQAGSHKGELPKCISFMEVTDDNLVLSSFKRAEDNDDYIFRIYNPTDTDIVSEIKFYKNIDSARIVNLNENELNAEKLNIIENRLKIVFKRKKIISIKINFK